VTNEDYKAFYDERAGIMEFDGGLTREKAEAKALEETVVQWMVDHPDETVGIEVIESRVKDVVGG